MYWWARHGIVVPSVSPVQEKLWSYGDLMCLRIVAWLRRPKAGPDDSHQGLPASPMPAVRLALARLDDLGIDLWTPARDGAGQSPLLVDVRGRIWIRTQEGVRGPEGEETFPNLAMFGLTDPFDHGGLHGPDLIRPREHLRIEPGKMAGEPHVENSRITSLALAGLHAQGFSVERIADMYEIDGASVRDAVSLESQLRALPLAA
jgi:uncharacterized protein (DUF433 family)